LHRSLAGRCKGTIEEPPVGVYQGHLFGLHLGVVQPARGDQDVTVRDAGADVAHGPDDEPGGGHPARYVRDLRPQLLVVQPPPFVSDLLPRIGALHPAVHTEDVAGAARGADLGGEVQHGLRDVLRSNVQCKTMVRYAV
jgi:hypothetical protein